MLAVARDGFDDLTQRDLKAAARRGNMTDRMTLNFEERMEGRVVVVSPIGRMNGVGAPKLTALVTDIFQRGHANVLLDCARMTYISSAGLRALVVCGKDCLREGGQLSLAALQPSCHTTIDVSGLLSVLDYHETVATALASLEGDRPVDSRSQSNPQGNAALQIEERRAGPAVIVSLAGRLIGDHADSLNTRVSAIVGSGTSHVILDCGGVGYINSAGLRALLLCAKTCQQEGGSLAIANLQPQCQQVVVMSGFLSIMDYHETTEAALAALA